jgi:hypothetical protein
LHKYLLNLLSRRDLQGNSIPENFNSVFYLKNPEKQFLDILINHL